MQSSRIRNTAYGPTRYGRAEEDSFNDLAILALITCLGLVLRLALLVHSNFIIDADEAIVGLMAKHIAEGRPWPVFYYGQYYMGSLEPLLAALAFKFLGQSSASLKLVPLVFSLFHIILVYALARRFVSTRFAQVAALLVALAPNGLILWSSMARGGFVEIVALGTLALILAIDIVRAQKILWGTLVALGLVTGLGWWVNNQMLFYLVPIGIIFPLTFLKNFGLKRGISAGLTFIAAFIAGGFPFWYQNLIGSPKLATFKVLFGQDAGGNTLKYLQGFFTTALPIILGSRRFWGERDIIPYGSLTAYTVYAVSILIVLAVCLRGRAQRRASVGILLLFAACVPLIFASSSFGWLSLGPRYLLPLYSVLFVLIAIAAQSLWETKSYLLRSVAAVLPAALLVVQVSGSFDRGQIAVAGQPFVFRGDRVADSHAELYRWLNEQGYRHIRTNYWIGYRVAFETNERVTFSRYGYPRSLRIPQYETAALEEGPPDVYIVVPQEAGLLAWELKQFGYSYRSTWVGKYVAIDQVRPSWERGDAVALDVSELRVPSAPESAAKMIDGDRDSRWGSAMPQHPGMVVEVDLREPEYLAGIDIDLGPFSSDAPRDLIVEGVTPDNRTERLFTLQGTKVYRDLQNESTSEIDPRWQISFAPQQYSKIRLIQQGTTALFDWSIAELKLYHPTADGLARARLARPSLEPAAPSVQSSPRT